MIRLRVREVQLYERPVHFRLPFRFGVITLTEEPQLFLRLLAEFEDGTCGWGLSAEVLAPKWFDKNPKLSNEENFEQLRRALSLAASFYLLDRTPQTPFELFISRYESLLDAGRQNDLNRLVSSFGPALLDRAVLDAVCRHYRTSFSDLVRSNQIGLHAPALLPELAGFPFDEYLRALAPLRRIHARHTVGLVDPITAADRPGQDRLDDDLPETLEEVIRCYGNRYFKLKVSGRVEEDLDRLSRIADVLDRLLPDYRVTLDGNEQYRSIEGVEELWRRMGEAEALRRLRDAVLLIEQPVDRSRALESDVSRLSRQCPVIIDESDEDLDSFARARYFGYRGVSSKQCKGIYKSLFNAARCRLWNDRAGRPEYVMSGEDLTIQPGIALQQDLALSALIGLSHVERNGHHYVRGFGDAPQREAAQFEKLHPDLYTRDRDLVRLRIEEGLMSFGSLLSEGYGGLGQPDWSSMERHR